MTVAKLEEPFSKPLIVVVDDDPGQRSLLESFLSGQGYEILTASSGEMALELLEEQRVNAVISDVRMPGISGLEMLGRIREKLPALPVLLLTAYPEIRDAVRAMRDGAVDYLEKPIDLDELLELLRRATGTAQTEFAHSPEGFQLPESVIAQSPASLEVFRQAALVAPSETRVLITGESGVGKEVVAGLIHHWSPRAKGPLVKVNCAAIPETLLESELFGHKKGAFTGAVENREGRFEQAKGGTMLLDEIAEMSPILQAKLLRVTQDGTFQRVGSNEEVQTDARILAATNRNLDSEVREGRFREDLFFRLNVIEIYLPPLRDRRADVLPLARKFVAEFSDRKTRFSSTALSCLELYQWPGNVRELRNAMERATLMARGEVILPEHLPKVIQKAGLEIGTNADGKGETSRMEEIERTAILEALRKHDYNRSETARALGISRRALLYKIRRYEQQGYSTNRNKH